MVARFFVEPVGIDDGEDVLQAQSHDLVGCDHLQVGEGISGGVLEVCALLLRDGIEGVERDGDGGVADGVEMDRKASAVGGFDDVL